MNEHAKSVLDGAAIGTTVSTLLGWLPHVAALLTIAWTAVRLYETKTVQALIERWRAKE